MSKGNYHCPSKDPDFKKYWKAYLPNIVNRNSFQEFHLLQLEVLCRAHAEETRLSAIIDVQGHSYMPGDGRNGEQIRPRPEVAQLSTCRGQILQYIKMLGLMPSKPQGNEGGADNGWGDDSGKE